MAVYKDGDKWRVIYRYTNYKGERKQTQKRGFATKREAAKWENDIKAIENFQWVNLLKCILKIKRVN